MDFPRLSGESRTSLEQAATNYHRALPDSPAISYLADRGIPPEAANTFRLGYVAKPEVGHAHAEGRLAIPYRTPTGVISIKFRDLTGKSRAKYVGIDGVRAHLFNVVDFHWPPAYIALCEGELDTLVMSHLVGVPAVGMAGVSDWRRYYKHCFADYDRVFIVMDNDDKERNSGQEAARKVRADLPNGVIVTPPLGLDVNDWVLKEGTAAVRESMGLDGN